MEALELHQQRFRAMHLPTEHSALLVIQGVRGFLSCGYIRIETAEKLNEAVAIVTGVKSYEDMLRAPVVEASAKAQSLGIRVGMAGEDALKLLGGFSTESGCE